MRRSSLWLFAVVSACGAPPAPEAPSLDDPPEVPAPLPEARPPAPPERMAGPEAAPSGRVQYTSERVLSVFTRELVDRWRRLAAAHPEQRDDVFSKIGASSTASTSFMTCFAGSGVVWAEHAALASTRDRFLGGDAGGEDPFSRKSLCATSGWSAFHALAGDPSPLQQELSAARPRFAHVAYGTNDIGFDDLDGFTEDMLQLVDTLLTQGTIPWLSTILPRRDSASADAWVPRYNAVIRAVAQGRGVPLLDFWLASSALPGWGMASDGVHPKAYVEGGVVRPCVLTPAALAFGYNTRNLLSLQLLERLARHVLDAEPASEVSERYIAGRGTAAEPFVIDRAPFVDLGDTRTGGESRIDRYSGCSAPQDESGRERYYVLTLTEARRLRISVHSRAGADVDVHLLRGSPDPSACVARDHKTLTQTLPPGRYFIVLDTFVSRGAPLAGEYVLTVLDE